MGGDRHGGTSPGEARMDLARRGLAWTCFTVGQIAPPWGMDRKGEARLGGHRRAREWLATARRGQDRHGRPRSGKHRKGLARSGVEGSVFGRAWCGAVRHGTARWRAGRDWHGSVRLGAARHGPVGRGARWAMTVGASAPAAWARKAMDGRGMESCGVDWTGVAGRGLARTGVARHRKAVACRERERQG